MESSSKSLPSFWGMGVMTADFSSEGTIPFDRKEIERERRKRVRECVNRDEMTDDEPPRGV